MLDIIPNIFNYVTDGKTYKSILYSSKLFYDIMIKYYPYKRYQVYNQLWSLIKLYPDSSWDWDEISANINTTIDIINNDINYPLEWSFISRNTNITMDIIKNNNYPWDFNSLSYNKNLTIDFIIDNINNPWSWFNISCNKNITMDII